MAPAGTLFASAPGKAVTQHCPQGSFSLRIIPPRSGQTERQDERMGARRHERGIPRTEHRRCAAGALGAAAGHGPAAGPLWQRQAGCRPAAADAAGTGPAAQGYIIEMGGNSRHAAGGTLAAGQRLFGSPGGGGGGPRPAGLSGTALRRGAQSAAPALGRAAGGRAAASDGGAHGPLSDGLSAGPGAGVGGAELPGDGLALRAAAAAAPALPGSAGGQAWPGSGCGRARTRTSARWPGAWTRWRRRCAGTRRGSTPG